MATSPDDVIHFWLGEPGDPPLAKAEAWWKKDTAFDREIKERFEATLDRGVRGELADWETTPRGRLALVILYDQFSRNMFRGTARSFAQDPLARAMTARALAARDLDVLAPIERSFVIMPLMHAEDLTMQQQCIDEYVKLRDASSDEKLRATMENSVSYGEKHKAIIVRFGRFPHRNAILGRASTPEEVEFLKQPGSSF